MEVYWSLCKLGEALVFRDGKQLTNNLLFRCRNNEGGHDGDTIFSALFAYIALGEVLSGREWVGAFIIFIGFLVASYQSKSSKLINPLSNERTQ